MTTGDPCPACGYPVELEDDPDYLYCQACQWSTYPLCPHGIRENEFCVHCPGGGV